MSNEEIKDQFGIRREKLDSYKGMGINTYPTLFKDRLEINKALELPQESKVRIAGRIMSKRMMGKASFTHLKDATGLMQIYVKLDEVGADTFSLFKTLDIGDFIGIEGPLFVTRTGEKTVQVKKLEFLAKSLRPLPEKYHKLKDVDTRYRKRYLDLLVNDDVSRILKLRAQIINMMRKRLSEKDYIEVETPILQEVPGGAAARPFITHHNVFDADLSLRIAPELYLKRLLVGGWDKVYEIGRNFRNEGISTRHNPEFTMMEVYCAYTDFNYMKNLAKELITGIYNDLKGSLPEQLVDFEADWVEKDIWDLINEHTGMEFSIEDSFEDLKKKAEKLEVPPGKDTDEKIIDRIFSKYVEEKLQTPTIVTGYLAKHSPLAKRSPANESIAERFEIFIGGQEVGNAYSEQNDPQVQKKMFELQLEDADNPEAMKNMDYDYIEALEYGMPPASGLGIGIDRLVMLLTGVESIREVILFPMLKPIDKE